MSATAPQRGLGSVVTNRSSAWRRYGFAITMGVGVVVVIVGYNIWGDNVERAKQETDIKPATATKDTYKPVEAAPLVLTAAKPTPTEVKPAEKVATRDEQPKPPPTFTMKTWAHGAASSRLPVYMQEKPKPTPVAAPAAEPTSGIAYKAETLAGSKAFVLKNPDLVLAPGTGIMCSMETSIITGVSGANPFRCHTTADAKSPGSVTMLETGTIVEGTYQNIVGEGQKRIVAVTATARSPYNVIAVLGGPVADSLGAAGVEGTVNNHWPERIGGAMVLSLVDGATSVLTSALQSNNSGNSINFGNAIGGGSALSQTTQRLLDKTINIPPTISLNQGTMVMLWVTKFVDFSDTYALEAAR